MIEVLSKLLSFSVVAAFFAGVAALLFKATPSIPARVRAFIWLTLSFLPLFLTMLSLLASRLGWFTLSSFVEPLVLRLLGYTKIGSHYYAFQQGYWQPIESAGQSIPLVFWTWAIGAFVLLIVRCYQLFLAQQFAIWAEDNQDERVLEEAEALGMQYGVPRLPKIRESHLVRSPLVVGVFRFTLLMPNGMSRRLDEAELKAILAHEFSHIAGRDTRVMAFLILNECLYWFNPVGWLIHREWATCRELDADSEALRHSKIEPKQFASLLLSIVTTSKTPWLQTAIGATRDFKALKTRLLNMKTSTLPPGNRPRAIAAFFLAAVCSLLPWQLSFAAPTSQDDNLVVNGGFEDGLDSWTAGTMPEGAATNVRYGIDTQEKHSGKSSLKFEKTTKTYFPVQHVLAKLKSSTPTKRVETTCWIKAKNTAKATISIEFIDEKGDTIEMTWAAYAEGPRPFVGLNHDWKQYKSVLEVPSRAKSIRVYTQMYGPGEAWFDDIKVRFVADSTPIQLATSDSGEEEDISDIKDVPSVEFQAKKDPKKNYFLIGSKGKGPEKGYKLLLIMPGGDGSKDFNSFVRRMWKNAELQKMGFVVAQLVAPVWETSENRIVWPIRSSQVPAAQFKTEVFVNDVIADVQSKLKIDPEHIYAMGWSSGGVPTYAALLDSPSLKGAFVAMSIFNEQMYPTLSLAKSRSVYLYQSPDDKVTKYSFAEKARDAFKGVGARVELASYTGGHGFSSGQPFEDIKLGLEWLTKR